MHTLKSFKSVDEMQNIKTYMQSYNIDVKYAL